MQKVDQMLDAFRIWGELLEKLPELLVVSTRLRE